MPRTPTEVRPALRIALKAYSAQQANRHGRRQQRSGLGMRTDLEEPAFRREDRDVAIIPGAATAPAHRGLGQPAEQQLLVPETTMPLRLSPLVGECLPSISGRYRQWQVEGRLCEYQEEEVNWQTVASRK